MNRNKYIITPYLIWIGTFVIVPLILVLYYAFTDEQGIFTLFNIMSIGLYENLKAFGLSFVLSLVSTIICFVLAFFLSYIICTSQITNKNLIVFLIVLPMWMNSLLRTLAWLNILEYNGLINIFISLIGLPKINMINNSFAIILGMVYNFLPFMILPIFNSMAKIDKDIINSSIDLGANNSIIFRQIIIPLTKPGILSGIAMVFIPALTTFIISDILGGGKVMLIGNVIEQEFKLNMRLHVGCGLSVVLMIFVLIIVLLSPKDKDMMGKML